MKRFTSGDELTLFIPKAIAWVGPKEKAKRSAEERQVIDPQKDKGVS